MKRFILIAVLSLMAALPLAAQESEQPIRPVTSAYTAEFGQARLADTYLSPLTYNGEHYEIMYRRSQAMAFSPDQWTMTLSLGLRLDLTKNLAQNATMVNGMLDASWSMMRKWTIMPQMTVGIGPQATLDAGSLYLGRNGNNPASAKANFTLDAAGFAQYKFSAFKVPMTVRWDTELPVTGCFFEPNYGQLYYQIYMGDTSGLAHAAWWGNYFSWNNRVSIDFSLGATTLRIGYHGRLLSTKANNLVTHAYSNAFVIGITTECITLRPGKKLPNSKIISAF